MSKNWKQRVREIAENQPDKLHPMLRGVMANPPRGEAWDRVSWQLEGEGDIAASAAVRPIIAMLQWLNSRSLLTGQGKAIHKSIDRIDPANVSLTRDLAKPTVAKTKQQYGSSIENITALGFRHGMKTAVAILARMHQPASLVE